MPGAPPFSRSLRKGGRTGYDDGTHSYAWDGEGRPVQIDATALTYDALGRIIEKAVSTVYTQMVYSPTGGKLALMTGQTLSKAFVPLPGGAAAVYTASGLAYYRHPDWLGSSRVASTPTRTKYYDVAYAPYGESYAGSGTTDLSFTGQNQDAVGGHYDFLYREYNPVHGRWISPDPAGGAAVDVMNPQSWNRYAYVLNNPLAFIDPYGLDCAHTDPDGNTKVNYMESEQECAKNGGSWIEGSQQHTGDSVEVNGDTGEVTWDIGSVVEIFDFSAFFAAVANERRAGMGLPATPDEYIRAIADASPTTCGGGVFVYAGAAGEVKKGALEGGEGFVGYLGEYDSNSGWGNNVLLEVGSSKASAGAATNRQHFEPLLFLPVAGSGGLVGAPQGAGFYAGTPNFGGGAYVNVTSNAACQQIRGR